MGNLIKNMKFISALIGAVASSALSEKRANIQHQIELIDKRIALSDELASLDTELVPYNPWLKPDLKCTLVTTYAEKNKNQTVHQGEIFTVIGPGLGWVMEPLDKECMSEIKEIHKEMIGVAKFLVSKFCN